MTTAFKTVQDAIVTALLQAPQIVGARVYAGRARSLPDEHTSDINVAFDRITGADRFITAGPLDWDLSISVQVRARGDASTDAVTAIDPLLESTFARLLATTPPAGVIGWVVEPRIAVEVEEADTPIATCTFVVNTTLRTQPGVLTIAT